MAALLFPHRTEQRWRWNFYRWLLYQFLWMMQHVWLQVSIFTSFFWLHYFMSILPRCSHECAFAQEAEGQTVKSIDFLVTEEFGVKFYDSCKDVKFAALNTRAMDFVGGGAKNYSGKFLHLSTLVEFEHLMSVRLSILETIWISSLACIMRVIIF